MNNRTLARAPLRVSLAGGGSDLPEYYSRHGCHLLAAAVDQYVEVRLSATSGNVIVDDESSWTSESVDALPMSLTRCVLRRFGVTGGIAVRTRSTCPSGSGLGWSGALTVALVGAVSAWRGRPVSAPEAASIAFTIEHEDFGSPVGQQDPWVAALGGVIRLTIDRAGVATANTEPELAAALTRLLDSCLLLFRTPVRRSAAEMLGRQVGQILDEECNSAAAMAVIAALVEPFESALLDGDVGRLGEILHTHWQAKVRASPWTSTPDIDVWYRTALGAGAIGGKVVGAGGGGHLLILSTPDRVGEVVGALGDAGLTRVPVRLDYRGLVVQQLGGGHATGHER